MSKLKEVEEKSEYEHVEAANHKMLTNILPLHVAQTFYNKSELHHHLCHSVGVAFISIAMDEEDGEGAICTLKNVVSVFDQDNISDAFIQILLQHRGIEKIRSCSKTYVHDTPSTIGDLLAELTQFALNVSAFACDHGMSLNIG
uniref:DUF4371 domain-containing protein n=1 Tax=Ascaris lumbricoides TaxID=6252 RepID=A0A0M3IX09_ASCLU